jgi:hypothetical protein
MPDRERICNGARFSVWMTPKVSKRFEKAEPQYRARCLKLMAAYAERGPEILTPQQFKHQGRFGTGDGKGTKVAICAFKDFQLRVYGGLIPGSTEFVCTEIEVTKKKDQANPETLERAAAYLGQFVVAHKGEG